MCPRAIEIAVRMRSSAGKRPGRPGALDAVPRLDAQLGYALRKAYNHSKRRYRALSGIVAPGSTVQRGMPMTGSASNSDLPRARKPWVEPCLTKHDSLTAATQFQHQPQGPLRFPPGDPRNGFTQDIPCSQGFCP